MIKNVMQGKDEGAENLGSNEDSTTNVRRAGGITGRVSLGFGKSSSVKTLCDPKDITYALIQIISRKA